jgi:hypothetical protein
VPQATPRMPVQPTRTGAGVLWYRGKTKRTGKRETPREQRNVDRRSCSSLTFLVDGVRYAVLLGRTRCPRERRKGRSISRRCEQALRSIAFFSNVASILSLTPNAQTALSLPALICRHNHFGGASNRRSTRFEAAALSLKPNSNIRVRRIAFRIN